MTQKRSRQSIRDFFSRNETSTASSEFEANIPESEKKYTTDYLQDIDDEKANSIVENEELVLISDESNQTGFWHVSLKDFEPRKKPYRIQTLMPEYGMNRYLCFTSKIAAAIYISQHLGASVCKSIVSYFEDGSDSQILTNIRIPSRLKIPKVEIHGQVYGGRLNYRKGTWRHRTSVMYEHAMYSTKVRNGETKKRKGPSREHKFDWTKDLFRSWVADTLEEHDFKCRYSHQRLTPTNVSLERLDETRGYSAENCALIHIAFQTGLGAQWSRKKFMDVYDLCDTDTYNEHEVRQARIYELIPRNQRSLESKRGNTPPRLFTKLSRLKWNCSGSTIKRNFKGRDLQESEISVEYLIDLWEKQRGRCYYLNIPMSTEGDWQVSLERIDNSKGYTKDNVALATLETQNSFHQFTKEFVENAWGKPWKRILSPTFFCKKYHLPW